jgi:hypothetical protein
MGIGKWIWLLVLVLTVLNSIGRNICFEGNKLSQIIEIVCYFADTVVSTVLEELVLVYMFTILNFMESIV